MAFNANANNHGSNNGAGSSNGNTFQNATNRGGNGGSYDTVMLHFKNGMTP